MSSKTKRVSYPSKDEIIEALKDDKELKGFEEMIVVLEFNRKSERIGLIKGELRQNDEIVIRGKLTVFPKTMAKSSMWDHIEVGGSIFYGFQGEFKEETLFDLFADGFRNSIREGKFPFLHR